MNVVVLVPRRADNGRRDQLWRYVKGRWEHDFPEWPIHEGNHDDGPFNRSAAINRASEQAGDWDVAVIVDADTFTGPEPTLQAVNGAYNDGRMWLAYDRYIYLNRDMSDRIMDGYQGDWLAGKEFDMVGTCSCQVMVRRDVWDEAEGFDEGFFSWGYEDIAASHAFQTFGNGLARAPGWIWHLHHPPSLDNITSGEHWDAKRARADKYQQAAYDKDAMRALIRELGPTRRLAR